MSLRDLNWRKGFFRLWLLASSIWVIIGAMAGAYPSAIKYIESVKAVQEIDHCKDEAKMDISKIKWDDEIDPVKLKKPVDASGEIVPDADSPIIPPDEADYTLEEIYKAAGKEIPEHIKPYFGYTAREYMKIIGKKGEPRASFRLIKSLGTC